VVSAEVVVAAGATRTSRWRMFAGSALAVLVVTASATAVAEPLWRFVSDVLLYSDNDNVHIATPQVGLVRTLDDDGGQVGVRAAVDVISAASVDVVTQATNRFSEVRSEAGVHLSKSFSGRIPSVSYRFSQEPDYISHGGHIGISTPVRSKDTTVSGGYGYTYDRVGRHGTSFDSFSESMQLHSADASITQVLSPRTLVRLAYTLTVQDGYMEKPYRQVPMFTQAGLDRAAMDGVTLGLDNFADYALSSRPAESVPDRRYRHALATRMLHFVPSWDASLKLDYQLYTDSWGVLSNLVEPAINHQLTDNWMVRGFVRIYHQTAADFWQKTYVVSDAGQLPKWRTLDKSLTSYLSTTAGGRAEWRIAPYTFYADGAFMLTNFTDYLYLDSRMAVILQLGVRWEL